MQRKETKREKEKSLSLSDWVCGPGCRTEFRNDENKQWHAQTNLYYQIVQLSPLVIYNSLAVLSFSPPQVEMVVLFHMLEVKKKKVGENHNITEETWWGFGWWCWRQDGRR